MMLTVDTEGLEFCSKIFNDVRAMSKDGPGVTRQGYGPVETKTLDYLTAIGRDLGLEIKKDLAGNVWMTLPGKDRTLPAFVSGSHRRQRPRGRQLRRSCRHHRSALHGARHEKGGLYP